MNIDKEAAKAVAEIDQLARNFDAYELGLSATLEEQQKYIAVVVAFGHRCAEDMREMCKQAIRKQCGNCHGDGYEPTSLKYDERGRFVDGDECMYCGYPREAISRLEVK